MADVDFSVTELSAGERGDDLIGAGEAVNSGQTFEIDISNRTDELLLLVEELGTGTATVTLDAGDNPPSLRAGLGEDTFDVGNGEMRPYVIEGGRHVKKDGKLTGSVATNNVRIWALRLPRTW